MNNKKQDNLLEIREETKLDELNQVYRECLDYLQSLRQTENENNHHNDENHREKHENDIEEHETDIENNESDLKEHENDIPTNVHDKYDNTNDESKYNDVTYETIEPKCNITEKIKLTQKCESEENMSKENQLVETAKSRIAEDKYLNGDLPQIDYDIVNELKSNESVNSLPEPRSRLRRLSQQLPKIIITNSNNSLDAKDHLLKHDGRSKLGYMGVKKTIQPKTFNSTRSPPPRRNKAAYGVFPKRLVSKTGLENVALISNVPFEKIRLLNDTFHTLINLRWRWIVSGTVVVHFGIWLVFAVWWYVAALAHYDLEPDPPRRACVTGGKDFVTIFLASVEAQTTIGFGDRAIDEECPEAIFLFIMQLILGTGLSGVLTCVVYAKLTRPEKLSRDGVGFSKKAVISLRDGQLCLMMRAWDLNYDHIISSEFSAHFVTTHRTKEGETLRYYTRTLKLLQRQFLLWPVTLVHVIDEDSPLYRCTPDLLANGCYEITVSLKGASASMGTFTQSQTSYMPHELIWGHRFPPVVKYDKRNQKYVIEHRKLDVVEPVDTPYCSAWNLHRHNDPPTAVSPSSSFSDRISTFVLERSTSFKRSHGKVS